MVEKQSVCQEAHGLIHGDRNKSYGHPYDDFSRTADMWTALFKHKLKPGESFKPRDVGLALICVKLSRETNKVKRDNLVDICGYAGTVEMVYEKEDQIISEIFDSKPDCCVSDACDQKESEG